MFSYQERRFGQATSPLIPIGFVMLRPFFEDRGINVTWSENGIDVFTTEWGHFIPPGDYQIIDGRAYASGEYLQSVYEGFTSIIPVGFVMLRPFFEDRGINVTWSENGIDVFMTAAPGEMGMGYFISPNNYQIIHGRAYASEKYLQSIYEGLVRSGPTVTTGTIPLIPEVTEMVLPNTLILQAKGDLSPMFSNQLTEYEVALAEYNRLMNIGQLTTEATTRLIAAEMAAKPTMAQPTVTTPQGEVIYPSLVGPGGEYTPPPITEIHSPYETYLPSTQEIIGGQGEMFIPILPPITTTPPIIPSMSPQQRMAYYITQFGSPQAYANEIWEKVSNGIPLDDGQAAIAFVNTYPSLFPSVSSISSLVIDHTLPDWWPVVPYVEGEITVFDTVPLSVADRISSYVLSLGGREAYANEIKRKMNAGIPLDDWGAAQTFIAMHPELFGGKQIPSGDIPEEEIGIPEDVFKMAGFSLDSNWPILAIVGIGLLMSFKGGKKGGVRSRKRTRKNPCRRRR